MTGVRRCGEAGLDGERWGRKCRAALFRAITLGSWNGAGFDDFGCLGVWVLGNGGSLEGSVGLEVCYSEVYVLLEVSDIVVGEVRVAVQELAVLSNDIEDCL